MAARWPGKVNGKAADVSVHEDVHGLFEFVDRETGGLDVLVNNAGVGIFAKVSRITNEEWDKMIHTNLSGAFYCSREAVARFASRGSGDIVNISSLAGKNAFAGGTAYNASKFGLNGFSEALLMDTRYDGVRVSTVMPGSVATEFGRGAGTGADGGEDWKVHPEDVAGVVRMLLQMPERTIVSQVEIRPAKPKRS
jgi:NAD(P)-dependent dehydrogenase (short-subunit alcohol dehydrogenase family)